VGVNARQAFGGALAASGMALLIWWLFFQRVAGRVAGGAAGWKAVTTDEVDVPAEPTASGDGSSRWHGDEATRTAMALARPGKEPARDTSPRQIAPGLEYGGIKSDVEAHDQDHDQEDGYEL